MTQSPPRPVIITQSVELSLNTPIRRLTTMGTRVLTLRSVQFDLTDNSDGILRIVVRRHSPGGRSLYPHRLDFVSHRPHFYVSLTMTRNSLRHLQHSTSGSRTWIKALQNAWKIFPEFFFQDYYLIQTDEMIHTADLTSVWFLLLTSRCSDLQTKQGLTLQAETGRLAHTSLLPHTSYQSRERERERERVTEFSFFTN